MNRRSFLFFCLLLTVLLLSVSQIGAQQTSKVYRIGYLKNGSRMGANEKAFRKGLREHGYVEGEDIVIEWRLAKGKLNRHSEFAAELVRLKVDCIVTIGVSPTRAAKQTTSTIPIIMGDAADDPVRQGLIASFARPGGNVTGVVSFSSDLAGKRLEILKGLVPKLSRVAILWKPQSPSAKGHVRETEAAARALGVQLRSIEVRRADDIENALGTTGNGRTEALIVVGTGGMNRHRERILDLAVETRLPVMYTHTSWVRRGGLISYATDIRELRRRAAAYVDKILKGAKPANLPVEYPTKFELVINLKTAKQIGLTISPEILLQATKVIK